MNLFENLQKLNESFYPEITVELYKDINKEPITKNFDDEYDEAIQFANDNINKDFESIYITISTPNGPSTLNVWEKNFGWHHDPKSDLSNIANYFRNVDADYFVDNDLFSDEEEFEENLNESSENFIYFGINYCNIKTGIYGIMVFDTKQKALKAYNTLKGLEDSEYNDEYEIILQDIILIDASYVLDDIDYRDITDDLLYDDIKIINRNSIDLYEM